MCLSTLIVICSDRYIAAAIGKHCYSISNPAVFYSQRFIYPKLGLGVYTYGKLRSAFTYNVVNQMQIIQSN